MALHNEVGKLGEELAAKFLEEEGFRIFDRNYNYHKAEVDIVAYWENPENPVATAELHFVEVKTRTDTSEIKPEEVVDTTKFEQLAKVARFYLYERQLTNMPVVFDVIAVGLDNPDDPEIDHFEDVYRPDTRI